MLNELIIIRQIKEGDIKAFEKIFRKYYSPLCLYAASIISRFDIAEEIVQDLFYVFWKERENINILYSVKNYLYGSVRNRSLQYCEHQKIHFQYENSILTKNMEEDYIDPQYELEYKELRTIINSILNKLPARRNCIFKMHRFEGKKYTEIALTLSLSVKTVEAEMSKALHTLRKEIENYREI